MLSAAGSAGLHLRVLYQSTLEVEARMVQTLESDLSKIGVSVTGVPASPADFYNRYLEVPSVARAGGWDMTLSQWLPDWYGDAAYSFFFPLFDGPAAFPPQGSNFGLYDDPRTAHLIQRAASSGSSEAAAGLWAEADRLVMADAVIYPITSPADPVYHAAQVHNPVFVPNLFQYDPTNVWLSPSKNGP
jgi:peptide/nickel transport system substrate-binding protein